MDFWSLLGIAIKVQQAITAVLAGAPGTLDFVVKEHGQVFNCEITVSAAGGQKTGS